MLRRKGIQKWTCTVAQRYSSHYGTSEILATEGETMLDAEGKAKVQRQIATFTDNYRQMKALGYNVTIMGLPSYETQEDFDRYQTHLVGSDFQIENEFMTEILKGLLTNGVPARLVTIRYPEFEKWLNGRENNSSTRASYCGHLISEDESKNSSPIH